MPFFQNVFDSSFTGVLVLSDRQFSMNFSVPANTNSIQDFIAWNREPWNLAVNKTLTFNYSFDSGKNYASFGVDVSASAVNTSAVTSYEVATALNNNTTFAALYTASVTTDKEGNYYLKIKASRPRGKWKTYISNTGAEFIMRFNKKAGVAELPLYFSRHTIINVNNFPDSNGMLIQLDPSSSTNSAGYLIDQQIITDAGLDYTTIHADWQLLKGRSGLFNFQQITVTGGDRITRIIEYPAGAVGGDFARQIDYLYVGSNTHPYQITEVPVVLTGGNLVTPPTT